MVAAKIKDTSADKELVTVHAADGDEGVNAAIKYSLENVNECSDCFKDMEDDGKLILKQNADIPESAIVSRLISITIKVK